MFYNFWIIQYDSCNEDRSFDGDFDIGYIDKILIKRHYLQECGANEWFNIEMINVAFKNIQFRSKNKVIALKAEVMYEVEVWEIIFFTFKFLSCTFISNIFKRTNWTEALKIHPELSKSDLQNADMIILPIWKASHWLFAVIDNSKSQIVVADSKRWFGNHFLELLGRTEDEINTILNRNSNSWKYIDLSSQVPFQWDGISCGPLAVINCEYYTKNLDFNYRINDIIATLRLNICLSVFLHLQMTKQ